MIWREHLNSRMKGKLAEYEECGWVILDEEKEVATFPFWTPGPIWNGYQEYRWQYGKEKRNNPKEGRYYTFKVEGRLPYYGAFSVAPNERLYVVEGVFEAIAVHAAGFPCIAVLSNSTKPFKDWLSIHPSKTIALIQPDKASEELKKGCDGYIYLSRDADEYDTDSLRALLKE